MKIERVPTPMVDWKKSRKYEVKIFLLQLMSRIKRLDHFTCSHQILHFPNRQRLWWPLISCILNHTVIIIFLVLMSRCPDIHIDVQISSMIEVEVYFACCWISFNPCPQLYPLILGPITILGPLIQNMGTLVGKGDGEKKRKEGKFWLINWLSKILVLCWTCWHWIEI